MPLGAPITDRGVAADPPHLPLEAFENFLLTACDEEHAMNKAFGGDRSLVFGESRAGQEERGPAKARRRARRPGSRSSSVANSATPSTPSAALISRARSAA
jgi:hypothetical protein